MRMHFSSVYLLVFFLMQLILGSLFDAAYCFTQSAHSQLQLYSGVFKAVWSTYLEAGICLGPVKGPCLLGDGSYGQDTHKQPWTRKITPKFLQCKCALPLMFMKNNHMQRKTESLSVTTYIQLLETHICFVDNFFLHLLTSLWHYHFHDLMFLCTLSTNNAISSCLPLWHERNNVNNTCLCINNYLDVYIYLPQIYLNFNNLPLYIYKCSLNSDLTNPDTLKHKKLHFKGNFLHESSKCRCKMYFRYQM